MTMSKLILLPVGILIILLLLISYVYINQLYLQEQVILQVNPQIAFSGFIPDGLKDNFVTQELRNQRFSFQPGAPILFAHSQVEWDMRGRAESVHVQLNLGKYFGDVSSLDYEGR